MFVASALALLVVGGPVINTSVLKRGLGLCGKDEVVFFDCEVKGKKHLSVCANKDVTRLQYRFGRRDKVELVFPDDSDPKKLKYRHEAWARGAEASLSYKRKGFTYRVVEASGSGIDGSANNYAGVRIFKGEVQKAFVKCQTAPVSALESLENVVGLANRVQNP